MNACEILSPRDVLQTGGLKIKRRRTTFLTAGESSLLSNSNKRSKPSDDDDKATAAIDASTTSSPAEFLKALFSANAAAREWLQHQREFSFSKPSQEAIDAYDLVVVRAVRNGDIAQMRAMLKDGRTFDACNQYGESILHMACRRGDVATVQFLLEEAHVNVGVRDDFGRSILHDSIWTSKPCFELVRLLFLNIPPELLVAEDVRGHTPFVYARKTHWGEWIAFLKDNVQVLLQKLPAFESA